MLYFKLGVASVPYFNEANWTEVLNKEEEKMGQYWRRKCCWV